MFPAALQGLLSLFDPVGMAYLFMGIFFGMIFGIIPGLNPLIGLALLLPFVYDMTPVHGLIFLVSMESTCATGGSVTAILVGVPGTEINAATILDGFPMSKQGHSGRALGNALTASALGGVVGAVLLALVIPVMRRVAMVFGSPEIFALGLVGLLFIGALSGESILSGTICAGMGIMLSLIGYQDISAFPRYTFGIVYLYDGIKLIPLTLGLFAIPTALDLIITGGTIAAPGTTPVPSRSDFMRGVKDVFHHWRLFLSCSGIGTLIGTIPGIGAQVAIWVSYAYAKETSKQPERFGRGSEEGIIAPESANNSKEGGALVPTLAFGIPGSATTAILLGAFLILGLQPGPFFLKDHPDIAFSLVSTLVVANIFTAIILAAACGMLSKIAFIRGTIVGPLILVFVILGSYSAYQNITDVLAAFLLGGLGYFMDKLNYSRAALFLGYILGAIIEKYFYLSLRSYGWPFLTKPFVLILVAIFIVSLTYKRILMVFRKRRRKA